LQGFTNFAWHYREKDVAPVGPEFLLSIPASSTRPLRTQETVAFLRAVLNSYGIAPNEY
jgi:hypothetical protein